jgi:hypothetical protein
MFTCQLDNDFQLSQFDVDWVIVFAEKDFDLILENFRPFFQDKLSIPKRDKL